MAAVEVSALVFREFDGTTNKPSYALIKLSKTFTTSDGIRRVKSVGNRFYKRAEITDNLNGTFTVAGLSGSAALDSTADGLDKTTATYRIEIYSSGGTYLATLYSGIRVPPSPSTTTWQDLAAYSFAATNQPTDNWYNAILSLFANVSTAPFASDVVIGKSKLSYPAINPSIPIAVSVTDPRLPKYLGDFSSLSDAVTQIGATPAILKINQVTTPTSTLSIPSNILVEFGEDGIIRPSSGVTVTINAMVDAGVRNVFGGSGNVVLGKAAVQELNLAWWTGAVNTGDVTRAFTQAALSLTNNLGGILNVPAGVWRVNNISMPSGATIQGAGSGTGGSNSTVLTLYDTVSTSAVVLISETSFRNVTLRNLTVSTGTSTASNCVRVEGSAPNTSAGVEFDNVVFHGTGVGSPPQVYFKDLLNSWEIINVKFKHCAWVVPSNSVGFKCDTNNTSFSFDQPFFYIGVGADAMLLEHFGTMLLENPTFNGISSLAATATTDRTVTATIANGGTDLTLTAGALTLNDVGQKVFISGKLNSNIVRITSPTTAIVEDAATAAATAESCTVSRYTPNSGMAHCAIKITGSHSTLTIVNSQDEGLQYFLINEASQLQYPITILGSVIQATILLTHSCTIKSAGNAYFSQTFTDAVTASAQIFSDGDYIDKTSVNFKNSGVGVELLDARLFGVKAGGSIVLTEFSNFQSEVRNRLNAPVDVRHGEEFLANPERTKPVFGAFTSSIKSGGVTKPQIRAGRLNPVTGEPDYYYDITRDYDTGLLEFIGNQDLPYRGYGFNAAVRIDGAVTPALVALTDAATIVTDAALGNAFAVTLTDNRTLGAPAHPTNGQVCRWWIKQNQDGNKTLTLATGAGGFSLCADIPNTTLSTTAGKIDLIEAQYFESNNRWRVINFKKGY